MQHGIRFLARPAITAGLVGVVIAAVMAGAPLTATGADTDPSLTGISHADDLVMARQLLMDSIETAMGPIDRAASGENIDLAMLKNFAYTIYTNLSVAPHLFPSTTKPVIGADGSPTPASAASPDIWKDFDAFYDQFTESANTAYDMSQAKDNATFVIKAKDLRMDCDGCHAKSMNVFDPSKSK
jgi:cytochrome c556